MSAGMSLFEGGRERAGRAGSTAVDLVRATYHAWREDRAIRLGAGLAYYALFAIVPLMTLAVALTGLVFSDQEIRDFLVERISLVFGAEVDADALATALASRVGDTATLSELGFLGLASLLVASSLVFVALQDAFNMIWHLPVERGIGRSIRRRVLASAVVLLAGSLLLASLAVQWVLGLLETLLPGGNTLLAAVNGPLAAVASWVLAAAVIVLVFRLLPRVEVSWRDAIVGATVTALLLAAVTWGFGLYLQRFASASVSGAAGGVLLVLVWLYYVSQVLLLGAELTKILGQRTGKAAITQANAGSGPLA